LIALPTTTTTTKNNFTHFGAEEMLGGDTQVVSPAKKLEDLIRLAELCVDLLRQNEEFYAEVNVSFLSFLLSLVSQSRLIL